MKIIEIGCTTALSVSRLPGLDYSLNPYRGCFHNCAYCYAPDILHFERLTWGENIYIKKNIPQVLAKELSMKRSGVIGLSTVTDPYQTVEKKYQVSRQCIELIVQHNFPICIQTKSSLVLRDLDLITKAHNVEVMISIGTLHEDEQKILEPGSSPIAERLYTLKKLSEQGIKTSVFYGPIYPTTTVEEIPKILDTFCNVGVNEVCIDRLNIKPEIIASLTSRLALHPEIKKKFVYYFEKNVQWYQKIHKTIVDESINRNMKITDAFLKKNS